MTIRAWRIVKIKHASAAFTGEGARKYGGRWNSPSVPMIYTAGSVSLAILEMLVHLETQELLKRYALFEAEFHENLVTTIHRSTLPRTWRRSPPPTSVQKLGDQWMKDARSAILRVPSTIVPSEWNFLLNREHPDFSKIKIGPRQPIHLDPRLIKIAIT